MHTLTALLFDDFETLDLFGLSRCLAACLSIIVCNLPR